MTPWALLVTALATGTTSRTSNTSPWSPAAWRIQLDIGREVGTTMPEEWAASGARLGLSVDVLVESETTTTGGRDFMGGTKCSLLSILKDPTFVTTNGEETVRLADTGGWKIATRRAGKAGDASVVRFWLDFIDSATRNDVRLDAGERLHCTTNGWRAPEELDAGRRRIQPLWLAFQQAQDRIDQRLPHETGDRRLDGTNPVETVMAYADMAVLVKNRDDRLQELREAERTLPSPQLDLSPPGRWPGTTEDLVMAPGKVVLQRRNLFGVEDFYVVGKWTATPLVGAAEYNDAEENASSSSSSSL